MRICSGAYEAYVSRKHTDVGVCIYIFPHTHTHTRVLILWVDDVQIKWSLQIKRFEDFAFFCVGLSYVVFPLWYKFWRK